MIKKLIVFVFFSMEICVLTYPTGIDGHSDATTISKLGPACCFYLYSHPHLLLEPTSYSEDLLSHRSCISIAIVNIDGLNVFQTLNFLDTDCRSLNRSVE